MAVPASDHDDQKEERLPLTSELIGKINQSPKPHVLSKLHIKRLTRLGDSYDNVDLIVRIRDGKVIQTAHTIWHNTVPGTDQEA
jgi:hypothetical protein